MELRDDQVSSVVLCEVKGVFVADAGKLRRQLETHNSQQQRSDQIVRELQSQVVDFQEALAAKDSQLGVLRVRFEESERQCATHAQTADHLRAHSERILQDHTSASGVHSQALDSVKAKLNEAEDKLRQDTQSAHKMQVRFNFKKTLTFA